MCQHPAHQVNISRKAVLCVPDSRNFFRHPVLLKLERALFRSYRYRFIQSKPDKEGHVAV